MARVSDIERLDEKVDAIEEIAPELLLREPRAIRQAAKKVWDKPRHGKPK